MSLRAHLVEQIRIRHGQDFTHREMVEFCLKAGYKPDNGTRTLRAVRDPKDTKSYDPHIRVRLKDGVIMAYYWDDYERIPVPSQTQPNKSYQVVDLRTGWACNCPSYSFTGQCKHINQVKQAMGI